MRRYVGIIEEIDWSINKAHVRIPNRDGFSEESTYQLPDLMNQQLKRTPTASLQHGDIPRHLQGLRVGDIVLCIDAEYVNDDLLIISYHGSNISK